VSCIGHVDATEWRELPHRCGETGFPVALLDQNRESVEHDFGRFDSLGGTSRMRKFTDFSHSHPADSMSDLHFLTALPVYNEADNVNRVLDEVHRYSADVLVVDDGSTDGTSELLEKRPDFEVVTHEHNQGYGAALRTAFQYAIDGGYEVLVTIDCDGQHEPQRIPQFVEACRQRDADIVSGSRYLQKFEGDSAPPEDRRRINRQVTGELNERLGLELTDAFCGFKAYRTAALQRLCLTEPGYAMPLQLWVQAVAQRLSIVELPVPLIYLDAKRSFGGALDDAHQHYREVLQRNVQSVRSSAYSVPPGPLYDAIANR